jgi:hypothetical protein
MSRFRPSAVWLAVAGIVLFTGRLSASDTTVESLKKAIDDEKETNVKLKEHYSAIVTATKKLATANADLVTLNRSLLDPKLTKSQLQELRRARGNAQTDVKSAEDDVKKGKEAFGKEQKTMLDHANDKMYSLLSEMKVSKGKDALETTAKVFDLFVFSDMADQPELKKGSAFYDQKVWSEGAEVFYAAGLDELPALKKLLLNSNTPTKYAVMQAVGRMGRDVETKDKEISAEIFRLNARGKKAKLDKAEIEARSKISQTALDNIRGKKK